MFIVLIYAAIVNVIAFSLMGYDKSQAKKNKRRVPEKRLFLFAAIGGAFGGWLGMRMWRHKTKHVSFMIGFPLLFIVNLVCVYYLWQFTK